MQRLLLVIFLLLSGAPGQAEIRETHRYAITTNGISFGELTLRIVMSDSAYFLNASVISHGVLGFITQAQYSAQTAGRLDASGRMQSGIFGARTHRLIKTRTVGITFRDGRPFATTIEPESARTPLSDPSAIIGEQVDSLTALAMLATARPPACPPETRVYDGRRLVTITLEPADAAPGLFRCQGIYRIVDGPDHTLLPGRKDFALTLDYDLAAPTSGLASASIAASGHLLTLTRQ